MASTYTCYARIYLPLDSTGKPLPNEDRYYDLEIDGGGETFGFDAYTRIKKPVFCYGGFAQEGMVKIFDASKAFNVLPAKALLCKYKFTASASEVNHFITTMRNCLTYYSGNAATGNYALYYVTAGALQTYNTEYHNPFYATAVMCDLLGDSTLLSIYNANCGSATAYKNYRPWKMFETYHSAWSFETLNL